MYRSRSRTVDTGAYDVVKEGHYYISPMKYPKLLEYILSRENMLRAYSRVRSNGGAAGVDGMTIKELPEYLRSNWERIKQSLLDGSYQPAAVRGVEIPKPSGGVRLLGIPTVMDRLIQQAIHQVLSPIWEPGFSPYSYGFRPYRQAQYALDQALKYINAGYQDVIDLDLKSFFDRVNHDKLMALIRAKVEDKALLRLIRRYLQSGIMLGGALQPREEGTPQGGPLSPLLSNILLNELDRELAKRGHRFVRYAGDVSIFLRSKQAAKRVRAGITKWLQVKLHLEVNEQKTSVCRPVQFELLGHGFVPTYKKGEKGKYNLRIAPKSWKRLKMKIKAITRKTSPIPFDERIRQLNRLMRGWVQYFKHATGYQKFKDLDSWVRCRLRYCVWKQWKKPGRRYRAFRQLGIVPEWARKFAWSRMGGWAIACSPIPDESGQAMGTTVTEARLRQKGYIPFLEYYLSVKYDGV
jgi:RNA-directed DNA polymerase